MPWWCTLKMKTLLATTSHVIQKLQTFFMAKWTTSGIFTNRWVYLEIQCIVYVYCDYIAPVTLMRAVPSLDLDGWTSWLKICSVWLRMNSTIDCWTRTSKNAISPLQKGTSTSLELYQNEKRALRKWFMEVDKIINFCEELYPVAWMPLKKISHSSEIISNR